LQGSLADADLSGDVVRRVVEPQDAGPGFLEPWLPASLTVMIDCQSLVSMIGWPVVV
jgi:hypothetical protein